MEAGKETYYSDKLKAIINETFNCKFMFKNNLVVKDDIALSIVKKNLNCSNEIEKHIYNTISKILYGDSSEKLKVDNKVFYYAFFNEMCYSFINATLKEFDFANYMYTHFLRKMENILKMDTNEVLNMTHLAKANESADKFFVRSVTLPLDDDLLNLHKNIYKKALLSTFENGINPLAFWCKLQFNIIKTYEIELHIKPR